MPSPWRTVYKSAHKEVKIRPRAGRPRADPTPGDSDNFPCLIKSILALAVCWVGVTLVAEYWPLILLALAVRGMQSGQGRSKRRR